METRQIARVVEEKWKRVWVGYRRLCTEGRWWSWDEERKKLNDNRGRRWMAEEMMENLLLVREGQEGKEKQRQEK